MERHSAKFLTVLKKSCNVLQSNLCEEIRAVEFVKTDAQIELKHLLQHPAPASPLLDRIGKYII